MIKETFAIGRTRYTVPVSVAEKIRRHLGVMFAHEPVDRGQDVFALGQRVAELTFAEAIVSGVKPSARVSCRAPVSDLKTG